MAQRYHSLAPNFERFLKVSGAEMENYTAVILAAGQGIRMGPRGRLMPKGLIEVGAEALVARSIRALWSRGVGRILVVTGHLSEQYQFLTDQGVDLLFNADFARLGSLHTLLLGAGAVDGPLLILESDLIYAPGMLDHVTQGRDDFLVSGPTGAGDEVYVWQDDGRLTEISKDPGRCAAPPLGEMVGITALTAETVQVLRRVGAQVLARKPMAHYEEDGLVALAQERAIRCVFTGDLPWAEIDDEV